MDDLKPGNLLFLTRAFEEYFRKKNPSSKVSLINRIAKLEEIIDWGSDNGKRIKKARTDSGKWANLPLEESKYIVSIYYHDLIGREGQRGVAERGVPLFRYDPETRVPFFERIPDWIYKEILKQCESFKVELKSE
jgi:hypothetical protein